MFRNLAVLAFVVLPLCAQFAATGFLTGDVFDPAGSLVPGARVTARLTATGAERVADADKDGHFTFASLPVGLYSVRVAAPGFSTFEQAGIRLNVNATASIRVSLQVGQVSDSVTVSSDAPMVNTENGVLSQTVQTRYIQELPLNGRNAANLIRMVPGAVTGAGTGNAGYANTGATIAISVNGTRGNEVNYRLDGATHMDSVTNLNATYPNPDALQEFTVQTSNYSAQYGNFSGAVVNVVTRSGTNQYRGTAFHFLRNGEMNARNYFAAQSDNLKRNQFGATFGGPVLRNKLFFFSSYQGTIIRNESFTNTAFVPSTALRQGDFRELGRNITDPLNNNAIFPNATIPASRIRPIATNLLSKVPFSTAPNGLLRYARPDRSDAHEALIKMDYDLGKHRLSGSGFYNLFEDPGWNGAGTLLTARIGQRQTTNNWKLQHTWVIRPNLVNTVVASGLMLQSFNVPTSTFWMSQFGPIAYREPETARQLELGVTGYGGWGSITNSPPGEWIRKNSEIVSTLSWIRGKHHVHIGAEYTPSTGFDSNTKFQQSGNFSFSGQLTGNGIADLLIGRAASFTQSAGKFKQTRGSQISLFADDNWRVNSRLTLTAGLRWDPYLPYHDELDQVAGFRAGYQSKRFVNAPPGAIFAGEPGFPRGGMQRDWNNFAPRFGFALRPFGQNLAIRGGYGIFYVRPFPRLYNNFVESAPFSPTLTLNAVDMQDPYGSANVRNPFPPFAPVDLNDRNQPFSFPMPYAYFQEDWGVGYSQAWNLTIERQLFQNWLIRAAYVGNKGTNLQTFRERNWAIFGPGATVANTNARRPLGRWFGSMREMADAGNSVYHSMQITLDKRFSRHFSVLAFYTWSKSIDDESANNQFGIANPHPIDTRFNRGVSDYDVPHNFRVSGVFDLPKWRSQPWAVRAIAGGWSFLSILDWRSGLPFGLFSGRDNSFSGIGLDRADVSGDVRLATDRPRNELLNRYFNRERAAFNAVGTFGNAGRNTLRALPIINLDLALQKELAWTERIRLQLRGEFFNALNRANFNAPGTNVSAPANFGIITGAADPRILQIGARLAF